MPRHLRLLSAGLGSLTLALATSGLLASTAPAEAFPQLSPIAQGSALSVEQARSAALRILKAVKDGDANARYGQFSAERQAITSPSMIAATMRTQPKVLGYTLLSVRSGMGKSTVEAELNTSAGKRVVFMVLNGEGKLSRYYVDRADDATSQVAKQFIEAVSTGNFISAQSFLSPDFQ